MKYSLLDLAQVSEGFTIKDSFEKSLRCAQLAEKLGYTRFWLAEHHNMKSVASAATSVLMGYIAANTSSIRVGSGGIMLPNHSPLAIAEQIGTLAQIYNERIDLGIGRAPGSDQFTAQFLNPNFQKDAQNFLDQIYLLQQFLYNDQENIKVRAFVAENTNVPMYILGSSTDSAHVASTLGLPYAFASHFAPKQMKKAYDIYVKNFEPSEFLDKPYFMICVNAIIADTNEQAKYISSSFYRTFLGLIRNQLDYIQKPDLDIFKTITLEEKYHLDQMLSYSFIGDKETVEKQIQNFLSTHHADELIVTSPVYSLDDKLNTITKFAEIMQQF